MDAIDILGSLLGRKAASEGSGGQIIRDVTNRQRQPTPSRTSGSPPSQASRPISVEESAQNLEVLLGVATDHHVNRKQAAPPSTARQPAPPSPTIPPSSSHRPASLTRSANPTDEINEHAQILIRAMIHAAKSDGQITEDEQQAMIKHLGNVGDAEINFLRAEFSRGTDVRELAWSVPLGMEDQVYIVSLMTIRLDQNTEAEYLRELAHGLRLSPERCNEIHRRYGVPEIFR